MAEDFEEEAPRRKRRGKTIFSRKRIALAIAVLIIFSLGALFQHYYLEPLYGETIEAKYTRCLTQKNVLDERFADCMNQVNDLNSLYRACEYQLQQC